MNMNTQRMASYGTWTSPITPQKIAEGTSSIINLLIDGETTYWCELRPANKGRYTIVKREITGDIEDVTPPDFNARTFVHEYGGGAFTVSKGVVYASNGADSKIYVFKAGRPAFPLTEGQKKVMFAGKETPQGTRFADLQMTKYGLIAIGERHEPGQEVENFLALIDTATGKYKTIASGYDFYSSPAISPDETRIAWISWNHPNMPWTNTELWIAQLNDKGELENSEKIAGDIPEAIFQPQWSQDNTLYFVTDRDRGWWNIHRYREGILENICPMEAEVAVPLWNFGRSTWTFLGDFILFTYNQNGVWKLALLDLQSLKWKDIPRKGNYFHQLRSGPGYAQFLEGYSTKPEALMQMNNAFDFATTILKTDEGQNVDEGYVSAPQHIHYKSDGRIAYAFYYPPKNKDFIAPAEERPPLVVMIHGGPISQASGSFNLSRQYWTSQGYAVLDVNYGGSTGYGRNYRQALNRKWGIVDVEDCVNGALYLVERGCADRNKLAIRGGSAGGYTTLAALAFKDIFKAGASYYGVADITGLALDTHKFEKHDMGELVGKYPEEKEVWKQRSPINHVDNMKQPLIIFQGENDLIVPKNQSEMIHHALKKKGIRTELHIYPGEEHGFRQAKHIIHSLEREADFYREIFDLK
jgi:dipeptidyl aminopeptidase/acylaminoacyl peptidase